MLKKQCKFGRSWDCFFIFIFLLFGWALWVCLFVYCFMSLALSFLREVTAPEAAPRCPDVDVAQRCSSAECPLLLSGRISARLPGTTSTWLFGHGSRCLLRIRTFLDIYNTSEVCLGLRTFSVWYFFPVRLRKISFARCANASYRCWTPSIAANVNRLMLAG